MRVYRNCTGFGSGVLTESFDRVLFVALQFLSLEGLGWAAGRAGWAGYEAGLAAWAQGWGWGAGVLRGAGMGLGSFPTHLMKIRLAGAGRGCGLWGLDIGLELGWDLLHTFNENSKLLKMQLNAKFTQFLFILLLRV